MDDLDVNVAILGNICEYHSSSSSSSRTRLCIWSECKICKESSLEHCGTVFSVKLENWSVVRQKLCRVWHSPGWPCSRSWSCTGDLPWNSRQAPWQGSGRGGRRTWGRSRETVWREHSRTSAHADDHGWKWRHTDETWATCDSVRMSAMHLKTVRSVLRTAQCSRQCALWCSCNWSQCAQDFWSCAWRYTQCSVAFVYHKLFVNIRCRMYSIYTPRRWQ